MRRALLVLALAGCYRDADPAPSPAIDRAKPPPLRTMQQLPVLDLHGAAGDEYVLFERVRAVYAAAGFAEEAKHVDLILDEHALVPAMAEGNVVARHFLGTGPAPRDHVAVVSHFLYGDRLPAPSSISLGDYRAFMTALVCNQFAHAIAYALGKYDPDAPWVEETRAIDFERGCVGDLVRARAIPDDSLAAYDRFDSMLLAAAPTETRAFISTDVAMRATEFGDDFPKLVEGMARDPKRPHDHPEAAALALAMLAVYRHERAAIAAPSIAAVARELGR